jgi:hypothetical protein
MNKSSKSSKFKHPEPPKKDYHYDINEIQESIENMQEKLSDVSKKLRNSDSFKRYSVAKKTLEISPQYAELQGLLTLYQETQEYKEKEQLTKDLKKLKKKFGLLQMEIAGDGNQSESDDE